LPPLTLNAGTRLGSYEIIARRRRDGEVYKTRDTGGTGQGAKAATTAQLLRPILELEGM